MYRYKYSINNMRINKKLSFTLSTLTTAINLFFVFEEKKSLDFYLKSNKIDSKHI